MLSPAIHCKLEEPKDTILSHIHSANSNSFSSIATELELDLEKNSLEAFIKIWKVLLIAETYSEAETSIGLFLQVTIEKNMLVHGKVSPWNTFAFSTTNRRETKIGNKHNTYLGETSLKNSQAWRRKSGQESKKPHLSCL